MSDNNEKSCFDPNIIFINYTCTHLRQCKFTVLV